MVEYCTAIHILPAIIIFRRSLAIHRPPDNRNILPITRKHRYDLISIPVASNQYSLDIIDIICVCIVVAKHTGPFTASLQESIDHDPKRGTNKDTGYKNIY
jgi:hypothetical protein